MKIMPIFLPVISFGLPAGLVLYFAVSNIYRIGQQAFITRSIYGGKASGMTWKDMFGLGPKVAAGAKPQGRQSTSKDSSKAKAQGDPGLVTPTPKGKTSSKAPAKTTRRPRPRPPAKAPAKTSARARAANRRPPRPSTRSSKDGPETATPAKAPASETAADTEFHRRPRPRSPPVAPSRGATSLQPRARKKKR